MKDVLFLVLYQEIIQFMQMYCRTWGIQIAGNRSFQQFCYRLLDSLAVGQVYYLIQTALDYLYNKKALQPRNENFINTNILKRPWSNIVSAHSMKNGKHLRYHAQ